MSSTCVIMRFCIVFLALLALAASEPLKIAANQEILRKQQDVIYLLENMVGELPNEHLREIGMTYEFESNLQSFENPSVVKYYVGLVKSGHVQPKGTPYSVSVSGLRKEVALLIQILLGAEDYQTFLNTAAWARVHVNQDQFVKAFVSAVLQRHDLHGVILPPVYEVYPHYFFDTRIIQKVHDYMHKYGLDYQSQGEHEHGVHYINVNYTSYLPYGENQIAYFTEDIGLSAYYSYIHMASYMLPYDQQHSQKHGQGGFQQGDDEGHYKIGHGSNYYYLHQQLLARYNLERLGQGLGPIKEMDYYYEHIETPFKPNLRYLNGVNFPGRDEHIYVTPRHHNYELVKLVRALEQRIIDAIDLGHIITPQGAFLSLYQPDGLNILGELIEGTGRSANPRYYGSFQDVAKNLLGNVPEFNNIWEYTPSALELGQTAVRDPIFYQLFSKILELFHYYQESLPSYQYNDVVVPGVNIEKVEVSDLVTYFSDYEVDLNNAVPQPAGHHLPTVRAHLKRLDHKQYEYTIHVQAQKPVQGAVVRVYVGPKYNYDGQPIDINVHRHYFFELDQFIYDLTEGHNIIVRNSQEATGQSYDWPSIQQIKEGVEGAFRSQNPFYIMEPHQLFGFPARLSLPKGTQSGYPLQWFVIITSEIQHQPEHYGPIIAEEWMTYQPQHYQIVEVDEYDQFTRHPIDKVHGGYQTVEVLPEYESQIITEGNWHWGYLYKKYPGSYYYPHWQQTYYNMQGIGYHHQHDEVHGHHYPEHHEGKYTGEHYAGKHGVSHEYSQEYKGQVPHVYQHVVEQPQSGKYYETVYKQDMHYGQGHGQGGAHHGSGHHSSASKYDAKYPSGVHPGYDGRHQYLHNYYENKHIGDVIGGTMSLDGKPFGYPFDRQLAHSAFYARNIYVKDVVVYHHDEYIPEY